MEESKNVSSSLKLNKGAATANHVLATRAGHEALPQSTAIFNDSSNLLIGAGMSRISPGTTRALEEQERNNAETFSQKIYAV